MKKIYLILGLVLILNSLFIGFFIIRFPASVDSTSEHDSLPLDESDLFDLPLYEAPEIEEAFNIYTLEEHYGKSLSEMVYLDESIITYDELRYLTVLHVGYDGLVHEGEIIVNQLIAEEVLEIFRQLYDIGFPIERMEVISKYDNSDNKSMEANNTHGFNFRKVAETDVWSEHAFGLAIDINPRTNPYVKDDIVKPINGEYYVDRNQEAQGMIRHGEAVYQIFSSYGWIWGGDWAEYGFRDYHHFEKPLN